MFFLVLAARTLPLRALVSCSSYLYDFLFIARITSRMVLGGPPVLVNVLSSELVLDTLSRSRILVGLFGLHLFASPLGQRNMSSTRDHHQGIPCLRLSDHDPITL
jgi:hypothetical protein